ncbi:S41 family peptidase [Arthrobacter cryoconiti]|uniref:S41 family peptidase n=1 Tax=Arthrobacter cryoconiti TaxID=748907 RepID=A0ABV8R0I7_9MICC|nr:S41 family peptidase [Arthrobacter cryoconiti]MCC9069073.1 PDZ domain-containing protein [Arthrobacter cryoconiti]
MTSSSYLRYPHLYQDTLTFVAQDDVWVAPLSGGRAWRVSSEGLPPRNPRFTPDGKHLVWTLPRGESPEVVTAPVDGGPVRQLTYWGHPSTTVKGFAADGSVLVTSAFEQPDARLSWAYGLRLADGRSTALNYGPVNSAAYGPVVGDERPVVVSSVLSREPSAWKRYRGGTSGKLWIDRDGSGEFSRLAPELDGNLCDPMWVGGRVAFLSDHEGHGNLYSVLPDGSNLRRHTDFEGFYVRHASTDGTRIVFESAGNLFLISELEGSKKLDGTLSRGSDAVQLDIKLGATVQARTPRLLKVAEHLGDVVPLPDGRSSVVESHGTLHLLTHSDGPARVIVCEAGVRARLARPLGSGHIFHIADNGGEEALYIRKLADTPEGACAVGSTSDTNGVGSAQHGSDSGESAPTDTSAGTELDQEVRAVDSGEAGLPHPVSAQSVNNDTFRVAAPGMERTTAPRDELAQRGDAAPVPTPDGEGAGRGEVLGSTTGFEQARRIDFPERTRAAEAVGSPDGGWIAIGTEFGQVYLVDVTAGSMELLSQSSAGAVEELVFSPDSAWLLWSEPLESDEPRTRLRMAAVRGEGETRIVELTDGRFADHSPAFTPDGKFVAFLSRRSFDPVYDTHSFDLSFPMSTKPFLMALSRNTQSPFGPYQEGAPHAGLAAASQKSASAGTSTEPAQVVVDVEGLAARIIGVPVAQGSYTALAAVDGALLWQVDHAGGATGDGLATASAQSAPASLERFELASKKTTQLVPELDQFRISADGKWILTVLGEEVKVYSSTPAGTDENTGTGVDLDRILVMMDPPKVWGQAFDEAWRLQRDFFYTADMAGVDWDSVYARYRPIVERLGGHDDLVDLLWELHGELGTSHAYVTPAPVVEAGVGAQGHLGAAFEKTAHGWAVTEIMGGESSDPQAFSPLAAPGVAVQRGEILEAVNGIAIPEQGPASVLVGTAGRIVELSLLSLPTDQGAAPARRRVAVVPLKSEERLRYQQWVAGNRATVRQASNGTFGYLHVPDMMPRGWAQLHRDLDTETASDALVVDVRRNRGGHTSQLVAEIIGRRMDAWTMVRGATPRIYPSRSPRGPVVVLTDEFAGSDGDILTAVAKLRGIGPVVGMRTWGGVVGIDGRFTLADGTAVTQPRYAYWFRDGLGFGVENYGVDPDIEVPFPPHDYAAGNDPQLEAAIGVLLEMQQEISTVHAPQLSGYRNLAPSPLPPRP